MSCRKDVESAILNNVFDKHVKGRYTYDRISEDTIQINGLSDSPSSKAMTSTQAKIIADSLLKKIYNSTNGYVTGYTERFSNYDPYKIRLRVSPRYIDHVYTNLPTEDQTDNNEYFSPNINNNEVKYTLKSINILSSNKAIDWFSKADKHQWRGDLFYSKLSSDLQIPKDQVDLIKSLSISNPYNREQILVDLAANYSYSIEINTAKENHTDEGKDSEEHNNLNVPGGTNYKINVFKTPLIIPSIINHFFHKNQIGWFRSDESLNNKPIWWLIEPLGDFYKRIDDPENADYYNEAIKYQFNTEQEAIEANKKYNNTWDINYQDITREGSKTRRILELQSDLFQKGRDKQLLVPINEKVALDHMMGNTSQEMKELLNSNNFLQLLNKDNNWATFFVKSIIQDTAKQTVTEVQESDVEAKVRELEKEGLLEIDCKGKLKAEKGLATSFVKGGKWKVIKDLKGYPTHKEGGVDLTIGKGGVSIKNGNTQFTAKYGLVIPKN